MKEIVTVTLLAGCVISCGSSIDVLSVPGIRQGGRKEENKGGGKDGKKRRGRRGEMGGRPEPYTYINSFLYFSTVIYIWLSQTVM